MTTLALLATLLAQDGSAIDRLLRDLEAESIETREAAATTLERLGPPALPVLRKAHGAARDRSVAEQLDDVIRRIERHAARPPEPRGEARRLGAMKMSLAQAVEAAQKLTKGAASSAVAASAHLVITVTTYAPEAAARMHFDAATGDLLWREAIEGDSAAESMRLGGMKLSLAQAIEVAQRASKGVAGSASYDPKEARATVLAHTDSEMIRVTVDTRTGEAKVEATPHFPGEPATGPAIETASGLRYYELKVGTGAKPAGPESRVRVHYTGWLENGQKIDSSVDRQAAFETKLSNVIKGWTEGVGGMQVGGKRKLIIPARLGYGDRAVRDIIPAGATLVFDVELLEVVQD